MVTKRDILIYAGIPAGILVTGLGGYLLFRHFFARDVVLYTTDFTEGERIAECMPNSWYKSYVTDKYDVERELSQFSMIKRFVLIAHGSTYRILDRNMSAQELGSWLGPRLVEGAIVGLAGCTTGRGEGEEGGWQAGVFADGGVGGYAEQLRNAIVENGGPYFGEVRANTIAGHVTANPTGRAFKFSQPGQPGDSVMPEGYDWHQWIAEFRDVPATIWMLGGETQFCI